MVFDQKEYNKEWFKTEKGKNIKHKYQCSEKGKKVQERYRQSEKGYKSRILYERRQKYDAITIYGGKCKCCGEDRLEFLCIDHINGGGNKHRRDNKLSTGVVTYRWLKKNGYPKGFRVLCLNCNGSIGLYGYCPHTNKKRLL